MKELDDAIPERIWSDERSKRQTAELCGDEPQQGLRCTLTKGHVGAHECLAVRGPMRWDTTKPS